MYGVYTVRNDCFLVLARSRMCAWAVRAQTLYPKDYLDCFFMVREKRGVPISLLFLSSSLNEFDRLPECLIEKCFRFGSLSYWFKIAGFFRGCKRPISLTPVFGLILLA